MKILIVEDDPKIAKLLELELKHEKFDTQVVSDGYSALISAEEYKPDVVILDILLPGLNGKEVAKRLREKYPNIGIIMLTALGDVKDKVTALSLGADDYVVKPFSIEELIARIKAVARRKERDEAEVLELYGIKLFPAQYRFEVDGKEIDLSKTEFNLLYFLMRNAGIVVTKDRILEVIWGDSSDERMNLVEVYINYLRKKLGKKGKFIKTVRGVGYTFRGE
ncbi:MAG: DNA-binding response regulator [Dictyoglomus sp. NZ13-RE01]|nr:MAG: DNA-binding response regulator [Dictyoglomus sp. NZ13-RE01]